MKYQRPSHTGLIEHVFTISHLPFPVYSRLNTGFSSNGGASQPQVWTVLHSGLIC